MGDKVRGYAHRVDVRAEAARVWQTITDAQSLKVWCSPDAELQPRQGGLFRARVDRVTELEAHIEVFDPGRRMKLIYLPNPGLPRADTVITDDLMLEAVRAGTIVRLLGSGIPAATEWDTQYWRLRTSWQQALNRLKIVAEKRAATGTES